jgi:ABC-2 type transport system permease protein
MLSRRSLVTARTGARLLLADPAPVLMTAVMPLLFVPFLLPSARAQLRLSGYPAANGTEQLVPGVAVLFSFLSMMLVGTLFFREHAWGTWDRLRASGTSMVDIALGKVAPLYVAFVGQMLVVLVLCRLLFGFRPNGSLLALAVVVAVLEAAVTAFGVLMVALFRTMDLAMMVGNLGGMVMAGIGGAFAPAAAMPHWAQQAARYTPTYWALEALHRLSLDGAGLADVGRHIGVVAAFAAGFALLAALVWRPDQAKIGTT